MKKFYQLVTGSALAFAFAASTPIAAQSDQGAGDGNDMQVPKEAVAVIMPTQGNQVRGLVLLKQEGDKVHLTGEISNLTPGEHGFHIHQYGDLRAPDGTSAGGHYSPEGHEHGAPDDARHHAGDFGNITANEQGVAKVDKESTQLKLHFAIGRSIVVHAKADDLTSQPSGNAGPRIAIGVIGYANVEMNNEDAQKAASTDSGDANRAEFAKEFWSYMQAQKYSQNWQRLPAGATGFTEGKSPHGAFLKSYANKIMLQDPKNPAMKSIVVKENYDADQNLVAITPMYKAAEDYDEEHGNWYYAKFKPDGSLFEMDGKPITGKVEGCINCHSSAPGNDYLFTND